MAFCCTDFLLLLVALSAWNGEKAGRNLTVEGEGDDDPFDGNSPVASCGIIVVGGLNAAAKSDVPPPPLVKDSMMTLFLRLSQLQ